MTGAAFDEGRVPPHDLDAEKAVLSACLLDGGDPASHRPSAIETVADLLHPEHFYSEAHRRLFESCVWCYSAHLPVDSVQVASHLREQERLGQVGGMSYIAQILLAAPDVGRVRHYAQIVVDTWLVRQVIFAAHSIAATGYVGYGDAKEYVVGAADKLVRLSEKAITSSTTEHIRPIVAGTFKEIREAQNSGRGMLGVSTGFSRYDRVTSGLHPGDLTLVAGRPGMGKTSLAMAVAANVAAGDPERHVPPAGVAVFSLEMPRKQLANRLLCMRARVNVANLRGAGDGISPADWQRLTPAAAYTARLPLWIDDQAGITLLDLRAKLRWMQQECARFPIKGADGSTLAGSDGKPLVASIGLVVIDYLQLMQHPALAGFREQEISAIARGLKGLAKDIGLPVIALAQLNRALDARQDKRPQLSDLRESGSLEQEADNVVFVYRDIYYNKDNEAARAVAELIIAKQRNGPTDTVHVRFDDRYTLFEDLPEDYVGDRTGT
jgi:replicative DNA helicase